MRLPPHSTHFLQPLDVVIFQQWKHWHSEAVDHATRHGIGEFSKLNFLGSVEEIRQQTLKPSTIRSAFKQCGYVPFNPQVVFNEIQVNNLAIEAADELPKNLQSQDTSTDAKYQLSDIWSSPTTHTKLKKQTSAIIDFLRSSASPPDTPTRQQNRQNLKKFIDYVLISDITQRLLVNYTWASHLAQRSQSHRSGQSRESIQKGGVVYAHEVERDLAGIEYYEHVFQRQLPIEEKVFRLVFNSIILP